MNNSAFASYGLDVGIGPLGGSSSLLANPFNTARGAFTLSAVSSATFAASPQAAPEPASLAALGLGALALLRRRKRA